MFKKFCYVRFLPLLVCISMLSFLTGCQSSGNPSSNSQKNLVSTKQVRYRDGMICSERISPMFEMLGYQCICSDPYKSDNYSVKSSRSGFTTECQDPSAWAVNQDKLAAEKAAEEKRKAEQARILAIQEAKEAKEREEILRKIAPVLRPYCQSLELRKTNIIRFCDTSGNPSYCQKSRDKTEPLPVLPKSLEQLTVLGAMSTCYTQGFDVFF